MGTTLTEYFDQLGKLVDDRWTAAGRHHTALPEAAYSALTEIEPPEFADASALLRHLALGQDLARQRPSGSTFGQPPVVMYAANGIEIQALVWMEGTTSVHQHEFDGAFRVLTGSSLHVRYGFTTQETLADNHIILGELEDLAPEILRPGDTRPIVAGKEFIHALFHLERPSVTIVVRNRTSGLPFPQYKYRHPGIGFDGLFRDDLLEMRVRGLVALNTFEPEQAIKLAVELVANEDLWTAFQVVERWYSKVGMAKLDRLIDAIAGRCEPFATIMSPMYDEMVRSRRVLSSRGKLTDQRHRIFLALMVNLPDADSLQNIVDQLYPGEDASALIARWVHELSSPEFSKISGLSLSSEDMERFDKLLLEGNSDKALTMVSSHWKKPRSATPPTY